MVGHQPSRQPLEGRTVAVTGASGTLGRALLQHCIEAGAAAIALTSTSKALEIETRSGLVRPKTLVWKVGEEDRLSQQLKSVDILILNHGINVYGERTSAAIRASYEVNAFSSWRLLEQFLETAAEPQTEAQARPKEIWVNTSEAESNPAFSPLYELSKRTLGDLVTLRRLDAPCPIRKIILGPFKSKLNPVGIMDANQVARSVVRQALSDRRNIIVTINPLTFLTFPLKELLVSSYFRLFSQASQVEDQQIED